MAKVSSRGRGLFPLSLSLSLVGVSVPRVRPTGFLCVLQGWGWGSGGELWNPRSNTPSSSKQLAIFSPFSVLLSLAPAALHGAERAAGEGEGEGEKEEEEGGKEGRRREEGGHARRRGVSARAVQDGRRGSE